VKDTIYYKQAELVLRILPYVGAEKVFALKGGTAINFFVRDLPRISVDIDLTYVLINNRDTALEDISRSIESIKSYAFGYREDI
jgi:predicted nucleotidyltransferase component of viral defense system